MHRTGAIANHQHAGDLGRADKTARASRRRSLRWLASIAALLVIAGACGDDDIAQAEGASNGDSAADAAAELDERSAQLAATLRDNGLTSLASAVDAVDAVDFGDVTHSAMFTFLAPNDETFLSMEADEAADLLTDPKGLTDVLRNHLIPERLDAATLADMTVVESAAGVALSVETVGDTLRIGDATVILFDIDAAEGVIHIVETVLIP